MNSPQAMASRRSRRHANHLGGGSRKPWHRDGTRPKRRGGSRRPRLSHDRLSLSLLCSYVPRPPSSSALWLRAAHACWRRCMHHCAISAPTSLRRAAERNLFRKPALLCRERNLCFGSAKVLSPPSWKKEMCGLTEVQRKRSECHPDRRGWPHDNVTCSALPCPETSPNLKAAIGRPAANLHVSPPCLWQQQKPKPLIAMVADALKPTFLRTPPKRGGRGRTVVRRAKASCGDAQERVNG